MVIIWFPCPSPPPFYCQTDFALWPTVPLYDRLHRSGPAEEVVGERSPQEAGLRTPGVWRHQSTFLLQGPTHPNCFSYISLPLSPLFIHSQPSSSALSFLTGTELGGPSREEVAKSIQAGAEEWTGHGELCWGVHWDGSGLLSCEHAAKHRPPVPGQCLLFLSNIKNHIVWWDVLCIFYIYLNCVGFYIFCPFSLASQFYSPAFFGKLFET